MKLELAMYEIRIGRNVRNYQTDHWGEEKVLARNVKDAIKQIKLGHGEYISEVKLLSRVG